MKPVQRPARWIWLFVFLPLSGCEMVQNLPYVGKALPEAESRAIGAGCRHAGRAIEDCFAINPRATRSGIFAGWRDMNDYMTTGKIGEVKPLVAANTPPPPEPVAKAKPEDEHDAHDDAEHEDDAKEGKKDVAHADQGYAKAGGKTDAKGVKSQVSKPDKSEKADTHDSKQVAKAGGKSDKAGGKGATAVGEHADESVAEKAGGKASAKYVTSAERPPPAAKTSPRPRWEPGKKDEEDAPRVWERKPRT